MAGKKAFGAKFGTYAASVLTNYASITKISPFDPKASTTDTTSHDSPVDGNNIAWNEKETTLINPGQSKIELNYDPGNATHVALMALIGAKQVFKATMPPSTPAVVWTFTGMIVGVSPELPHNDKMTCAVIVEISGIPTVGTT